MSDLDEAFAAQIAATERQIALLRSFPPMQLGRPRSPMEHYWQQLLDGGYLERPHPGLYERTDTPT